jgi:hypothetical protein
MLNFEMTIDGVVELKQSLATWGASLEDFSVPFTEIADGLTADNMLNMVSEGVLYGPWPPLAASTIANRVRRGYGSSPMLINSNDLAQSIAGGAGAVREIGPLQMTLGTQVSYATYLQSGTKKMPARKIIGLVWNRKQQIIRTLGDFVRNKAREAGLMVTEA